MNLSTAPGKYDARDEAETRAEIMREDGKNQKKNEDVYLVRGRRLILQSPDGSQFTLTVANDGTLSATAL